MRLPTELWVKSYLRQRVAAGAFATVARHGDDEHGTVWIKINRLDGTAVLLGPAPRPLDADEATGDERQFIVMHKSPSISEADAEAQLVRARDFDGDLWIVEVEDREGRHGLEAALIKT